MNIELFTNKKCRNLIQFLNIFLKTYEGDVGLYDGDVGLYEGDVGL